MRLRNVTPKSLFGRMLAIILVPIILVQIISVFIFYERHWDSVSRHMSSNLANDLGFLIDELGPSPSNEQRALSATRARQYFGIIFYWFEGGILKPNQLLENKFTNFKLALENRIKNVEINLGNRIDVLRKDLIVLMIKRILVIELL